MAEARGFDMEDLVRDRRASGRQRNIGDSTSPVEVDARCPTSEAPGWRGAALYVMYGGYPRQQRGFGSEISAAPGAVEVGASAREEGCTDLQGIHGEHAGEEARLSKEKSAPRPTPPPSPPVPATPTKREITDQSPPIQVVEEGRGNE